MGTRVNDIGKVASALGLFASAIKSGEPWTDECELANKAAHDALSRIGRDLNINEEKADCYQR